MSTNALIGKKLSGDKVEYVYCHWDGYIEGVGATLVDFYDASTVGELLKRGNMSVLGSSVGDCVFYKDRGESNTESDVVDIDGYVTSSDTKFYASYKYLYDKDGSLYCYKGDSTKTIEKIKLK